MAFAAQDERLTRRVGAVVLLALVGATAFAIFVAPRLEWGARVRLRVYFAAAGGLREGARVVAGGADIGRVEAIALAPRGAPGPLGGEEGVAVRIAIAARAAGRLGRGGDAFVASRGPLGERYLELGPAPAGAAPLVEGDALRGSDPPTLDRALARAWENLTVAQAFARDVRPEASRLAAALARLGETLAAVADDAAAAGASRADLAGLVAEARALREVGLGGDAGLARLAAVVAGARAAVARVRAVLGPGGALGGPAAAAADAVAAARARLAARGAGAGARFAAAAARARAVLAQLDPLLAQAAVIADRLARGEGSLGRLLQDPELPEDAKDLGKLLKRQPWKIIDRPAQ